jgi:hypothetical protein
MDRLRSWLVLGCLFGVGTCLAPGPSARAANQEKEGVLGEKRAALWQALKKALPEKYKEIEAYAENPSLSVVLFRSRGATLLFSLKTGKVEEVPHRKALGKINRITFEEGKGGGNFALWYNGQRELTIAAER